MTGGSDTDCDVVVVAYNSGEELYACVQPLIGMDNVTVTVVDNASTDAGLDTIRHLPVRTIQLERNGGFAHGVNVGWRAGTGEYVLLLNPDARIEPEPLRCLVSTLEDDSGAGAAAPRIVHSDGSLDYSQRRFPRLRSTYAQALFLHRIFAGASWTDELVRDRRAYDRRERPEWVSGACILVRRSVLEQLDGLDEGFFMYGEDIDLGRRMRALGYEIVFEPTAIVVHEGGASAPRTQLLPVLAASRLRYAAKHRTPAGAFVERIGIAIGAFTHMLLGRGGRASRAGHARALLVMLRP